MAHIQRESLPKPKMTSRDNRFTFEIVRVLHFGNRLNKKLCCKFIFIKLSSTITRSLEILVTNLATNFQDLAAKVKNLVTLAPVLGTILRPESESRTQDLESRCAFHRARKVKQFSIKLGLPRGNMALTIFDSFTEFPS